MFSGGLSIFSDKQQRYLNSTESPVPMHLARSDDEEEEERPTTRIQVARPEDPAPPTATLPRITLEDSDKAAKKEKSKPPKVPKEEPKVDHEAEAQRRKLEEEADNILGALVPGLGDSAAPPIFSKADANKGRSVSPDGSQHLNMDASSNIIFPAFRLAREKRKGRDRDGSWRSGGSGLSGSRALLLNRNYTEDLPHMPRNAATAANSSYAPETSRRTSRMTSLIIGGSIYDQAFVHRALFGRAGVASAQLAPQFHPTTVEFGASREAAEADASSSKVSTGGLSLVWTEELEDSTSPKSAPGATYEVLIGHTGQRQGLRHDRKASRRARPAEAAKAAGDRAGAVDSWVSVLCKKLKAQDGRMKVKEKRRKRPKREGGGAGCGLTCS
eukprot:g26469.t1